MSDRVVLLRPLNRRISNNRTAEYRTKDTAAFHFDIRSSLFDILLFTLIRQQPDANQKRFSLTIRLQGRIWPSNSYSHSFIRTQSINWCVHIQP